MKDSNIIKVNKIARRQIRTRGAMVGTATKPRVSVFRSLLHIYVQAIDDQNSKTLLAISDKELKLAKGKKVELAGLVGEAFGKKLQAHKINEIIFDRGAYKYHGRVKMLADGIRKAGIKF